jgi:lipopolysaccharide biosynthesis protein
MKNYNFAIIAHFYYPDLVDQLFDSIERLSPCADVYATTSEVALPAVIKRAEISKYDCKIIIVENRGRDVSPFLQALKICDASKYNIILKVHTKKSEHIMHEGDLWRKNHLEHNIGDRNSFLWVAEAFDQLKDVGMIFHESVSMFIDRDAGTNPELFKYIEKYKLNNYANKKWNFSAGTMFYVRGSALRTLNSRELSDFAFESECGQLDGTLAHSMERLFPLFVNQAGFSVLSADYPITKLDEIKVAAKKMRKHGRKIFSTKRKRIA